jgi:hypothetical protein
MDVVAREVEQFELFLKLLSEQQNHLIANDLDNLNKTVMEQEQAILKLRDCETERIGIVRDISTRTGDNEADLTLATMARRLEKPHADRLERMQKQLVNLHKRIDRARARNDFLIKKSMEHIEGAVRLLASNGVRPPTYGDKNTRDSQTPSIMVNRTA